METDNDKSLPIPLTNTNNAKNVHLALLYQQRKKKENTKAQIIVSKIDAISDYYSDNVKANPTLQQEIKKYFQNPLGYRKAVLYNYLDEVRVMNKIINQGRRAMENNEYFLELKYANTHAYFGFKDFKNYGTTITLTTDQPINLLRYSNIEHQKLFSKLDVDMHTGVSEYTINLVGLSIGPFVDGPIQCVKKENILDIRGLPIRYMKNGSVVTKTTENGYTAFLKIIKHFYINTITIATEPNIHLVHDFSEVVRLNPNIVSKIICWTYDINKDEYKMNTYENIGSFNFQEIIKYMNSTIYDKIIEMLDKKLKLLIKNHSNLSQSKMEIMIQLYSVANRLFLNQNEKREMLVKEYLQNKILEASKIVPINESDKITMPEYIPVKDTSVFKIDIDMINPLHPQNYVKLEAYSEKKFDQSILAKQETKCQHENEWSELDRLRSENLNRYNQKVSEFIEKFAVETSELDFVCKICGQLIPLKQYVQDGSYDNNTQKFVTAYTPPDIALEDINEYKKYPITIKYLDGLINRISLITGTNMLVGPNTQIKQRRKALVKNIIDIIIKHNMVNIKKNIPDEERLDFYSKKFNIDKDLDSIFFFELEDSIFNFVPNATNNADLNRLKFYNVLLYFMLIFITELNGAQISLMSTDKIANIYTYLKYGPKLFGNLLIKKNINDMETTPITNYPVLCYLIFLLSYYLVKYGLWKHPGASNKTFNPVVLKIIINSFVDLFNSVSIDAGKMPNDYVYLLTSSKLYSQLNNTFKNNDIINVLKQNHIKYDSDRTQVATTLPVVKDQVGSYPIKNPIQIKLKPRKIPTFKISSGIIFENMDSTMFKIQKTNTDITNCPNGAYHHWISKGTDIQCKICGEKGEDVNGDVIRFIETYYYQMSKIAARRCIRGTIHDFVGKDGKFVCTICGRTMGDKYTNKELDELAINLNTIENNNIQKMLEQIATQQKNAELMDRDDETIAKTLLNNFQQENGDKIYGQMTILINKLIILLETMLGSDINLDIDKYPVYLKDNVYIIDHSYDGSKFAEPIIVNEKDNRIILKENHPFFKKDVYYYTDNRTQIDVFYDAVTLKLLGYKEKHKEYVIVNKGNNYLRINASIQNRLLTIGYSTKYIDIGEIFIRQSKDYTDPNENYFNIMDNLIRDHIFRIKSIIDKLSSLLFKVKNYQSESETENPPMLLNTTQNINKIISKYSKLIPKFKLGENDEAFEDWQVIRNMFIYQPIDWIKTNVRPTDNMYVNSDLINYYDTCSSIMIYYLVDQLIKILESNTERVIKVGVSQMYIEIINYVYDLYNMDRYKNSLDLKRFDYILNGSDVMVDILRRGQGLIQSQELEQQLDEATPDITELEREDVTEDTLEDIKEEAEALDIDADYYGEEDEDNAGAGGDYDE